MSTYSILDNDVGVQALTTSIYISDAPQGTTGDYIVLDYITINPENHLSDVATIEQQRISIDCYATTQGTSIAIFNACITALQSAGYVGLTTSYGELDTSTKLYLSAFDFSIWESR